MHVDLGQRDSQTERRNCLLIDRKRLGTGAGTGCRIFIIVGDARQDG